MNIIEVENEKFGVPYPEMIDISSRLDMHGAGNLIGNVNWKDFSYKPTVRFNLAYTEMEILLKYYVQEEYFRAEKTETNQMVPEYFGMLKFV